jgi:hypothetical protein
VKTDFVPVIFDVTKPIPPGWMTDPVRLGGLLVFQEFLRRLATAVDFAVNQNPACISTAWAVELPGDLVVFSGQLRPTRVFGGILLDPEPVVSSVKVHSDECPSRAVQVFKSESWGAFGITDIVP